MPKRRAKKAPSPLDKVQERLCKLHASGASGFEGLVRDAYAEVTGHHLRLVKSGQQGGLDVAPSGETPDLAVGIEAKRYAKTTRLGLDELKAKLTDACTRAGAAIDLWILVASKEVSSDDANALRQLGDSFGVGVLVLDWSSSEGSLAALPLLLSMAPGAMEDHLDEHTNALFDHYRNETGYELASTTLLKKLTAPDLGYSFAAAAVSAKLETVLADRHDAMKWLHSPIDFERNNRAYLPRKSALQAINDWAEQATGTPVCVATGDEGVGKSWVVLDWWRKTQLAERKRLTLFVSGRGLSDGNIEIVAADALAHWTKMHDREFWLRRVRQWQEVRAALPDEPFLWLVLDGANEGNSQEQAAELIRDALTSDWAGKAAIIITDRTAHWATTFHDTFSIETDENKIARIPITPFDSEELKALLSFYGRQTSDFPDDILKIIKRPSWFEVAAGLFDKEVDWRIYSREQLMVLYWQHRLHDKGRIKAPDVQTFKEFICQLGALTSDDLGNATLKHCDIKNILEKEAGSDVQSDILDDIKSGVWLEPESSNSLKISKSVLPFALGLALLKEVDEAGSAEDVDAICEQFLGALEDRDEGVAILRAANALAIGTGRFSPAVFRALLQYWLNSHNFRGRDFDLFWRMMCETPETLLEITDNAWMHRTGGYFGDEALVKSLAKIANEGPHQDLVLDYMTRWLGEYWLDPLEGMVGESDLDSETRESATTQNLKEITAALGSGRLKGFQVKQAENIAGTRWVTHRILALFSYLPRAHLIDPIKAWTISRAIMGTPVQFEHLAWALRHNRTDPVPARKLVESIALEFQGYGLAQLSKAADWLLEAEGSLGCWQQNSRQGDEGDGSKALLPPACEIIDGEVRPTEFGRSHEHILVSKLVEISSHPEVSASDEIIEFIDNQLNVLDVSEIAAGLDRSGADLSWQNLAPLALRWHQEAFRRTLDRIVAELELREGRPAEHLCSALSRFMLCLTPEHKGSIRIALRRLIDIEPSEQDPVPYQDALKVALFGETAPEQIALWRSQKHGERLDISLGEVLLPPTPDNLAAFDEDFQSSDRDRTLNALCYMAIACGEHSLPQTHQDLLRLCSHEDDQIRRLALDTVKSSNSESYGQHLLDQDWSVSEEINQSEAWYASFALIQSATRDRFFDIAMRISPDTLGALWAKFDYAEDLIEPFEKHLLGSLHKELQPAKSYSSVDRFIRQKHAVEAYIKLRPDAAKKDFRDLILRKGDIMLRMGRWPASDLMAVYSEVEPDFAIDLVRQARKGMGGALFGSGSIDALAFKMPPIDKVDELRGAIACQHTNDEQLSGVASMINRYGRTGWALDWVRQLLKEGEDAATTAEALTLAGFLDGTKEVCDFWRSDLDSACASRWLDAVKNRAQFEHEKIIKLKHWLTVFSAAEANIDKMAAWQQVSRLVAPHSQPIVRKSLMKKWDSLPKSVQQFVLVDQRRALSEAAKSVGSKLNKTLYHTSVGSRMASIWA